MPYLLLVILICLSSTPVSAGQRAELFQHAKAATALVVAINESSQSVSMGSGFFLSDDGLLVTNAHVVEGSSRLLVYIQDQLVATASKVLVIDGDADLAALRVPKMPLEIVSLADENPLEGTAVIAVGYPRITDILQMGFALHATIGSGIVSGMAQGRSRTDGHEAGFVQTTGILNFGNSGGPLVDTETGAVVGMVVTTVPYLERAKDRNGASIGSVSMKSGIGYSIPAPVIRRWLSVQHLDSSLPSTPPTWTKVVSHGTDPEADRSFATGHLLHTIALVLHRDSDLLRLAVFHYETAARLKPEAPWIARNLGLAYADSGQWSHALQAYLRGLEFAPHDAELLADTGLAWERTGDPTHAVEAYRAALNVDSRLSRAHNNLGEALWKMGQHDDAITEFRAALDTDPSQASASYNLGLAFESRGLKRDAVETWEAFLRHTGGAAKPNDEWTRKIRDGLVRLKQFSRASSYPAVVTSTR